MKKLLFFICCILITIYNGESQNNIKLNQNVVQDNTSLFSKEEIIDLTKKIIDYEAVSTNEICLFTLDSLPKNFTALQYATDIANKLGVGKKEKNNGLLILISKHDRQLSIATGYGTEKVLTDDYCKKVVDSIIIPEFKKDLFYQGINNALNSIIEN